MLTHQYPLEYGFTMRARFTTFLCVVAERFSRTMDTLPNGPNHALERTAARSSFAFQMIKTVSIDAALATGGRAGVRFLSIPTNDGNQRLRTRDSGDW